MKRIRNLIIILIASFILFLFCTNVSAVVLQAKPGVESRKTGDVNNHFTDIRKMEAQGGTLGLEAQINTTTYLDSSNNGVDVHMCKNTEWGTVAMLANSQYGEVTEGANDNSTTGNGTGVFQMGDSNFEYVAGYLGNALSYSWCGPIKTMINADSRYSNGSYTLGTSSYIKGDATIETKGWKKAKSSDWLGSYTLVFARGNGIFGYRSDNRSDNRPSYSARAVLAIGEGL